MSARVPNWCRSRYRSKNDAQNAEQLAGVTEENANIGTTPHAQQKSVGPMEHCCSARRFMSPDALRPVVPQARDT
eukprot:292965-Prymnesium_polylepis.1